MKKLLALVLAVGMIFVLFTACNNENEPNNNGETSVVETEDSIVGTWYVEGMSYYVFNADGTGTMMDMPIVWTTNDGVLTLCATHEMCEDDACLAPVDLTYELSGDELTVEIEGISITYTRG